LTILNENGRETMKILAVDTSAVAASAAICEGETIIGEFFVNNHLTHSQTLMPMVDSLLKCCNVSTQDIDLFAVSSGPGSFTGLRIGISAIKGMAMATGKPCAGVSTLEAMAQNLLDYEGYICAVMDARCGQVYNAIFKISEKNITRMTPDRAITIDELALEIEQNEFKYFFVGDGAKMCYNILIEKNIYNISVVADTLLFQRASGVARVAFYSDEKFDANSLIPEYLRMPQAERELKQKLGGNENDRNR
jgi:tRNA threonylcarbamoyladenosine biosynthesis protein TsaB